MFARYGSVIDSKTQKPTKSTGHLTHIFYAARYDNNVMKRVTLLDFSRENFQQILKAKKGIIPVVTCR